MSVQDTWEAVRVLDDAENWAERNEVLFKEDHTELLQFAKDILHELVNNLPICSQLECEHVDTFTEAALFDVDYLESLKMENTPDSDTLSRDSIYIKFDPLVSKMHLKASDAHTAVPSEVPDKRDLLDLDTSPHSWKGVKPFCIEGYYEASGFSPVAELIPANSDVLKYSDEDLMKLVQIARRRANQRERQKIETQLHEVREMIAATRGQMQSHYDNMCAMSSSKSTHLMHMDRIREEKQRMKERVIIYDQKIRERSSHFLELQKHKNNVKVYEALLLQDQTRLENVFDELHSCHVKQKELNKGLVEQIEEIETYLTKVHEWHRQVSEQHNTLVSKRDGSKEGLKQIYQAIQNEYETKLAIERTKTKKLQLKIKNLQEDLNLVKQDKQQLTQICDDLMKQLELNTRET